VAALSHVRVYCSIVEHIVPAQLKRSAKLKISQLCLVQSNLSSIGPSRANTILHGFLSHSFTKYLIRHECLSSMVLQYRAAETRTFCGTPASVPHYEIYCLCNVSSSVSVIIISSSKSPTKFYQNRVIFH